MPKIIAHKMPSEKKGTGLFSQKVIKIALSIPPGRVMTYGTIAWAAGGGRMAAQSVTAVLGRAYQAGETRIPWHRIVYAGGRVWMNPSHRKERMALYKKEGIRIGKDDVIENFDEIVLEPKRR